MRYPFWKACLFSLPLWVISILIVIWNPKGDFWGTVEEPKAQCEAYDLHQLKSLSVLSSAIYDRTKLDRLIREPQNTLSNLPYAMVGVAVLLTARRRLTRSWAIGCIFLGFGSGAYHAILLPEWRLVDILGVYVVLFGLAAIACSAVISTDQPSKSSRDWPIICLMWIAAFWTGTHRNDVRLGVFKVFDSTYVVVAGVAINAMLGACAWFRVRDKRRYGIAFVVLVIAAPLAFVCGGGDRFGAFLAAPEAVIQGHSVWHACGAIALLATYEIFAATEYDNSVFTSLR